MGDRMVWNSTGGLREFHDPLCGRCGHLASVHHWTGQRFSYCSTWQPEPCGCGKYRPDDPDEQL